MSNPDPMTPPHPGNGAAVTLREVYALLKEVRADVLLEIGQVRAHVDSKFAEHDREHTEHDTRHAQDVQERNASEARRLSAVRWAVTTLLAGAGVFIALYVAFKRGG